MFKCSRNENIHLFILALGIRLAILLCIGIVSEHSFSELANWHDGRSYLSISRSFPLAYNSPSMVVKPIHYPLFPFFIYIANLFFNNFISSAYFISVVASSLSVVVFYNITKTFSDNAYELSMLFCCFPPKWLHVSTYLFSEPVFILFLLLGVFFFQKEKYLLSFSCLGLSAIARPVGILFLPSFFILILIKKRQEIFSMAKYFFIAIIPFALFHLYLYFIFGRVLLFAHTGESGGWGGDVFSYPFAGLLTGLFDPNLLVVRKLYTLSIFLFYLISFVLVLNYLIKGKYLLVCLLFLPYFIFCSFLRGENYNWWMISLPRFLLPLAPAGIILVFGHLSKRILHVAFLFALLLGIIYPIGAYFLHTNLGRVI